MFPCDDFGYNPFEYKGRMSSFFVFIWMIKLRHSTSRKEREVVFQV